MNAQFDQGDMVMEDGRSKEDISRRGDGAPGFTPQASAEAKRLGARRRFLMGGAIVPIIVTVGRRQAHAISEAVCDSLEAQFGDDFTKDPPDDMGTATFHCRLHDEGEEDPPKP